MLALELLQGVIAVHRQHGIVAGVLQHEADDAAHIFLVIDDEDASHGRFSTHSDAAILGRRPTAAARPAAFEHGVRASVNHPLTLPPIS